MLVLALRRGDWLLVLAEKYLSRISRYEDMVQEMKS